MLSVVIEKSSLEADLEEVPHAIPSALRDGALELYLLPKGSAF